MKLVDIGANLTHAAFQRGPATRSSRAPARPASRRSWSPAPRVEESRAAIALAQRPCRSVRHRRRASPPRPGLRPADHSRAARARKAPARRRDRRMRPRLQPQLLAAPRPGEMVRGAARARPGAGKPLFLHSRDAHPRFAEILKHHGFEQCGGPLLHRRARGAARLPGPRPLHRHHRLDLRRAPRASTCSSWCARSPPTGCCSRPTRPISRRATCGRSPRRGATSRRSCRTSCAPWRAPSAGRAEEVAAGNHAQRRTRSSACMNLAHLLLRSARWLPERPRARARQARRCARTGQMANRVARLASGLSTKLDLQQRRPRRRSR